MRGKVDGDSGGVILDGITPAHAGKSPWACRSAGSSRDHPRACGEKRSDRNPAMSLVGSPPRMRGKVLEESTDLYHLGITPAHAGKRAWFQDRSSAIQDHPRACGEKVRFQLCNLPGMGSPPRMRGKVKRSGFFTLAVRITPAHAGKRPGFSGPFLPTGDHPRACGEKKAFAALGEHPKGSPPRMRGKDRAGKEPHPSRGITPAHAGKSRQQVRLEQSLRDHPRACGEKIRNYTLFYPI